jgi:hypothetical protein
MVTQSGGGKDGGQADMPIPLRNILYGKELRTLHTTTQRHILTIKLSQISVMEPLEHILKGASGKVASQSRHGFPWSDSEMPGARIWFRQSMVAGGCDFSLIGFAGDVTIRS